jgi:hypothetical protein
MAGIKPPAAFERQPFDIETIPSGRHFGRIYASAFPAPWDLKRRRAVSAIRADVPQRSLRRSLSGRNTQGLPDKAHIVRPKTVTGDAALVLLSLQHP